MSEKLNTESGYQNESFVDDDPLAELARIVAGEPEPVRDTAPAAEPVPEMQSDSIASELRGSIEPQAAEAQSVDLSVEAALEDALATNFAAELELPQGAQEITDAVNTLGEPSPSVEPYHTEMSAGAGVASGNDDAFEDSLISALQEDFVTGGQAQSDVPVSDAGIPQEQQYEAPVEQGFASFEDELSAQLEAQTAQSIEQVAQEVSADIGSQDMGVDHGNVHAAEATFAQTEPAGTVNLEEDLGAAFDKEFEQMLDEGATSSADDFQAAANEVTEPAFEPHHVQEPEFTQAVEPTADFGEQEAVVEQTGPASLDDLDFGSAFAEELGVDQIPEQSGWAEDSTQMSHDEFAVAAQPQSADGVYADPGYDGDVPAVPAGFGTDPSEQASGGSQRYAIAALVIALFAGSIVAGYGFLGGGDGGTTSGEPVVIKADNDPVKVKPDDPGGRVVANQDKATFTQVDGETEPGIEQESLISNTEEPALIEPTQSASADPVTAETNLPEKSDDRLSGGADEAAGDGQTNSSVTPRVVQTVTVKPDGTILTSAPTAPATPSVPSVDSAVAGVSNDVESTVGDVAATNLPVATPVPTAVIAKPEPIDGAQTSGSLAVPAASPLPKPEPTSVAAAPAPAPATTASTESVAPAAVQRSEWVVQVSSQRSAEAAQASFQNLRNRFSALQGRSMSIQRANVNGSTFFRVRVQTASRSDANQLCSGLKSAGGSCFVTR